MGGAAGRGSRGAEDGGSLLEAFGGYSRRVGGPLRAGQMTGSGLDPGDTGFKSPGLGQEAAGLAVPGGPLSTWSSFKGHLRRAVSPL